MNTLELDAILTRTMKKCNFIGVFACDQLPSETTLSRPLALVVNTDPSHRGGRHWLAIYIDRNNTGSFFDSFGNPPERFSDTIVKFLRENCTMIRHQTLQLQSKCSAVCGQYCIFFLNRMCKTNNFSKILATFKENTHWNDMRVCSFVKRLQPNVTCLTFSNNTCIQCSVSGEISHCNDVL